MTDFTLIPFDRKHAPAIELTGNIKRQENILKLTYLLQGQDKIIIPTADPSLSRLFDLWDHTCFEFFLGLAGTTQYWEFNLSPTGDWNVFRFPDYRQDIAEEMTFITLPFQIVQQSDKLRLDVKIDLTTIISDQQKLNIGITSVIEDREHQLSYWALAHPDVRADFHHRDSFTISL